MFSPPNKLKLDVLVYGYEKDKEQLKDFFAKLQGQLDAINRTDIGIVFGLADDKEGSLDKVKSELENMVAAPNYIFFDATETTLLMPTYIENLARLVDDDNDLADVIRHSNGFYKK
jgi:hypothetical protein